MSPSILRVWSLAALLLPAVAGFADDGEPATTGVSGAAERVLTIIDVIQERHIDPPAIQQMILTGAKTLYRASREPTPKDLSQRVSSLSGRVSLTRYLEGLYAEFSDLPQSQSIFLSGMLVELPGRGALVKESAGKIQAQLAANRYVGTGIALSMTKEKVPLISKVFYEGPAWKAGIKTKDLILEIDGVPTDSKDLRTIVEELRGESGSDVIMVVRQPNSKGSRTLTVTRGRVFIPSVEGHRELSSGQWQYRLDANREIVYLRINSIGPSTLHELRQVDAKLRQDGVVGIVLDVRSGGGLLHDVVMVADGLLDGGVIGHWQAGESRRTYEANPGALFHEIPMAVLVARHTNTDRVFLTAALQDQGRAVVVGEPTSGETYVNELIQIPGEASKIKVATGILQRGDGTPLLVRRSLMPSPQWRELKRRLPGFVMPNHVVSMAVGDRDRAAEGSQVHDDPILAKAVEILSGMQSQTERPAGG